MTRPGLEVADVFRHYGDAYPIASAITVSSAVAIVRRSLLAVASCSVCQPQSHRMANQKGITAITTNS
jgi:hypothetical protein